MKTSEAPDKIYAYIPNDDIVGTASLKKGLPHQYVTEEYTRTDAFFDKASIWFNNNFIAHDEYGVISVNHSFDTEEEMVKDFIEYMKGEKL